jgi:tripartite-type tricarboxylate transporter receptor subunit TctC
VVPEYRPGAGGVVAANYLYNVAPKDGTSIGLPLAPIVLAQYTGANVQYDASKFLWVGQIADITRLFAVWETSPIKTFQDLQTTEAIAGTTGRGSETYMNPALMNHVFGTKIKIVSGYKGSNSLMLALERGEISAVSGTWSNFAANHPHWLSEKKVRFVVQIGLSKVKGYEQVPLLSELAKNEEDRRLVEYMSLVTTSVGYSIIAPPGVPDPIIVALRNAFDATMKDPAFLAAVRKCCVDLNPGNHDVVAGAVARAIKAPKSLLERFIKATGP